MPRAVSRSLNAPARARSRAGSEKSVAMIRTRHVASRSRKCSSSVMAMLYGSWPVEQAADQMTNWRRPARRGTRSAMSRCSVSNGDRSRKNEVSCVISAQSTCRSRTPAGSWRTRSSSVSMLGSFRCRTSGRSLATTR